MQTDLYLIRHGETAANRARLIQGWTNEPLNALGRIQAERTAARMAGVRLDALYASTLSRAHETARCIARASGVELVLVDELREIDTGRISGLHGAQFMLRHPRLLWGWLRDDERLAFPDGETLSDFYARSRRAIDQLVARHHGQTLAVVAHGGIISGYLSLLLHGRGSNRISWRLRNGSISQVRWQDDRPPQLLLFNDVAHLLAPGTAVREC